ncbi:MAG: InlB B-repeat-containing protein, partial [Clostridia bacterium]|nr:InlB B-repeat-containing protein [Clostridia bacterium]
TVTLPGSAGFSRKFYTFGGWSTSSTGTNPYTSYTIYGEEPVTMYAIWIVNFMTVNFNLNGAEYGTRPASMQVEVGETIAAADLPQGLDFSKEGYIFAGWSDKANATQPLTSFTATGTGSKTLYAVWIADKVTLVAQEGSTTVIDEERGFIYGLEANITQQQLLDSFLGVEGNGHIELEPAIIGTGTKVKVINDFSGNTDATYEIVIFGDVNGDGNVNSSDVTELRNMNAGLVEYAPDSAQYFAADITHDGNVNSSDVTEARLANAGISVISQVIE